MPDVLAGAITEYLSLDNYIEDFYEVSVNLDGPIWKCERGQTFCEPGNPSWEAFAGRRWGDAVRLAASGSAELKDYFSDLDARACPFYRVRVAEFPLTPYFQWEAYVLRTRSQAGERIRFATYELVDPVEAREGRLPELVILGNRVGYAVDYSTDGTPQGAHRFTDGTAIARCVWLLSDLYDRAEDFEEFFQREVANLPQPNL